jgi:hypothetical protein
MSDTITAALNPLAITEDDPQLPEGWSPEELNLPRFVAYSQEYAWAQQYLRNFTPEGRKERESFLNNPEVERILSAEAECGITTSS